MTEDFSFIIASLVGILIGVVTIVLLAKHTAPSNGSDELEVTTNEALRIKTEQDIKPESVITKETDFPPDWFTSTQNFNLESRAIFSKSWIFLTHTARFSKPGDYHTFTFCGFSIFLILGKDYKIRGFHNVCRHRAYTITRKESGSSTVLGCKYHGWSYDVVGRLVKAPMFDGVAGFKKEDNGLFEIPIRVSEGSGAVFINLDAAYMSEGRNDIVDMKGNGIVDQFLKFGGKKTRWLNGRTVEGGFNWKHGVDPEALNIGIPNIPERSVFRSWFRTNSSRTLALRVFPNTILYKIPNMNLWYSIVMMPVSPIKTNIRWDLFSNTSRPNSTYEKAVASQIEGMVSTQAKAFENLPQTLNDDNKETQYEILIQLSAHLRVERALGQQITPKMHTAKTSEKFLQAEILCKELDCLSNNSDRGIPTASGVLAW